MSVPAEFIAGIVNGDYDDDLERILQALKERNRDKRNKEARINSLTLMPGAKVKLYGLSPAYLNGMVGTVMETPEFRRNRRRATLSVNLEHGVGRFGKVVNVPANCLRLVD